MKFNTIPEAIEEFKKGQPLVVLDDENRENEGDLIIAAEYATSNWINFMAKECCGLICMPIEKKRLDDLKIYRMVENPNEIHGCNFAVSVDHAETSTGISAFDRALTIKKLLDINSKAEDFKKPGHTFPLIPNPGGVLKRQGHTEAGVELAKISGLYPAAVICEIMKDDGTMARRNDLFEFSKKHGFNIITIKELVEYLA